MDPAGSLGSLQPAKEPTVMLGKISERSGVIYSPLEQNRAEETGPQMLRNIVISQFQILREELLLCSALTKNSPSTLFPPLT